MRIHVCGTLRIAAIGIAAAAVALSHYTWVAPVTPLTVGKPATIRISHGHKFPDSEEAINASQVDLFVLTPSGAKVKLAPTASATAVTATFTPTQAGAHRIGFVQDRGVSSRTPKGVKKGGRDQNPDATQSYRTFRTAMAYAGTGSAAITAGKPAGLEIELTGELTGGAWQVQLFKQGKPASGVTVNVFLAGAAKPVEAGKTGADGRIRYQPPAGSKGPAMFSVEFKDPAPAGAPYDTVNYESSLFVTW